MKKKTKKNKPSHVVPRIDSNVPHKKIVPLEKILQRVYEKEDLSTTCLRQCTCCRVACPQMKFSEASSIIDHIWSKWSKEDKKAILINSVKYFFSDSLVKPCLMMSGNSCREYERRPLNCRLYGLWPEKAWENRVEKFCKATGLPREKLPLNTQCPNVARKPQKCKDCNEGFVAVAKDETDSHSAEDESPELVVNRKCEKCNGSGMVNPPPLTSEQIAGLFDSLDNIDKTLGISNLKISASWNYRTLHDWILLKFYGEQFLSQWSDFVLNSTQEQRDEVISIFEIQAGKIEV